MSSYMETLARVKGARELVDRVDIAVNTYSFKDAQSRCIEIFKDDAVGIAFCWLGQLAREDGRVYEDYRPRWSGHDSVSSVGDGRNDASIRRASELYENSAFREQAQIYWRKLNFSPMGEADLRRDFKKVGDECVMYSDWQFFIRECVCEMHKTLQQTFTRVCLWILSQNGLLPEGQSTHFPMI